jgi:hypothetical protein
MVGRGKGGTVGLAKVKGGEEVLTAFTSCAHEDEVFELELEKHLKPLQRRTLIESWQREMSGVKQSPPV